MDIEKDSFLVPTYLYRFYLCDVIESATILEKKVEAMEISQADLLEAAKRLPINVQGILALSFRKSILKEATDLIVSFFINRKNDVFAIQPIFDKSSNR